MEELESKYGIFHTQLTETLNEAVTRLKSDHPPQLEYLTIIPDILRPGDVDFQQGNEDGVTDKSVIVLRFTRLVLHTLGQYLDDGQQDWFQEQSQLLKVWITLVELNLVNAQMAEDDDVEMLDSGIGGINTGFQEYRQINVDQLRALFEVLAGSCS